MYHLEIYASMLLFAAAQKGVLASANAITTTVGGEVCIYELSPMQLATDA
jgi:hypothetical protein